jgi:hypothetical protein
VPKYPERFPEFDPVVGLAVQLAASLPSRLNMGFLARDRHPRSQVGRGRPPPRPLPSGPRLTAAVTRFALIGAAGYIAPRHMRAIKGVGGCRCGLGPFHFEGPLVLPELEGRPGEMRQHRHEHRDPLPRHSHVGFGYCARGSSWHGIDVRGLGRA